MNRQIKFRAWDSVRKMMVSDFVIAPTCPNWSAHLVRDTPVELQNILDNYYQSKGHIFGGVYTVLDWSDYYGISNYEIMQFRGLYDCENKEVYEGDILEIWIENIKQDNLYTVQKLEELYFELNRNDSYHRFTQVKVIGNIFES